MLAREEEEFEMYQEFDRLRYEQEKHIYSNFAYGQNYRLMPEEEVPDYIKIKEEKKKTVLGRRRNYRDFYNVKPDIDESSEEERKSKKRAAQRLKRRRRAKAKAKIKLNTITLNDNNLKIKKVKSIKLTLNDNNKNGSNVKVTNQIEKDDIFVDSDD